ncbi:dihydroorotate dehydrogenase [Dethiosulfatarculus sandiegensis]|uniref:dihydroorotate dehydrogenase n=1 Tax=Dethiosulfatarculus sandiegensis TaxID=1429043 RepID=UPI0005C91C3B|nr:dihydroorotate dehydrogenase [Dethiosulfatarculus sandiegensis]
MTKEPSLAVDIAGLLFSSPVIAASGTFGYGREYDDYLDLEKIGGFVTKGVSLEPRDGNQPPRIAETACGMLNAIGLANIGLEKFLADKLPLVEKTRARCVVNLYGESAEEFEKLAQALDARQGVDALELNVSCPNVKGGGMAFGQDAKAVYELTRVVRQKTSLPLWVKLTPNVADPVPMAKAAADAGADALSLINTILAMAIDARTRKPKLGNVYGGLSGPAIKPVGLRMVHQVSRAVDLPVVGMGGIMTGSDVAEYLLAGASAVQVGTASFSDPASCVRIADELAAFMKEQGIAEVRELIGGLLS